MPRPADDDLHREIGLNPVGRDGRPAILATVMDISARKQAEEQQRLIIGELKHRTRNLLSVIQALITSALKESKTVAEAGYVLGGRIKSLSQAYSLLADAAWEGASLAKILFCAKADAAAARRLRSFTEFNLPTGLYPARDACALASGWLSPLLALEIAPVGRTTTDRR